MLKPKTKFVLSKSNPPANGKYPIILQVKPFNKPYRRITLGLTATEQQWDKHKERFKDDGLFETENEDLRAYERKANEIIKGFRDDDGNYGRFNFEAFKAQFLSLPEEVPGEQDSESGELTEEKPDTLLGFLDWYINYLTIKERIGDRSRFKSLRNVLLDYGASLDLKLSDVTKDWLDNFETYLLNRKHQWTGKPVKKISVWSHFKTMNTLYGKAIYHELISSKPFRNQTNPKGFSFAHLAKQPRISRSTSDEELERFLAFNWKNGTKRQAYAWKIAFFIYYFRGIPISDAALLTKDDIANNEVMFGRIKTHNKVPNIPLDHEKRQWILKELEPETDGYHLIPILHKDRHITKQQIYNRINKMKTIVNTGMKEIAKIQGVKMNMHTYILRHTFSRKVLESFGIWHLKETHGHSSVLTTQKYAGSLSNAQVAKVDAVL
ncbi:MAG: site-specific integrase [Bacteroidota bacterium]